MSESNLKKILLTTCQFQNVLKSCNIDLESSSSFDLNKICFLISATFADNVALRFKDHRGKSYLRNSNGNCKVFNGNIDDLKSHPISNIFVYSSQLKLGNGIYLSDVTLASPYAVILFTKFTASFDKNGFLNVGNFFK